MPIRGCGRDQRHDDGPGRAAAATFGQMRRPGPASLAASCLRSGRSPAPWEPHHSSPPLNRRARLTADAS